ncbi:30S ribosomal protein S5 [Candidatus Brocadiaceae bacterium]|nr:30S ribosomal protein S5 [Candidatus Brocadiaceae bacterium]
MSDQVKPETTTEVKPLGHSAPTPYRQDRNRDRSRIRSRRPDRKERSEEKKDQFENKLITIRRVTKMHKGGRRMKISVVVVVGDKKGRVGIGVGKGEDVRSAQDKAVSQAKKNLVFVNLKGNTIPHEIEFKYKSSRILLKPAAPGTGIVAGSSVRQVAEVVGIHDVLGKILGADNKVTNAYATIYALAALRNTRL